MNEHPSGFSRQGVLAAIAVLVLGLGGMAFIKSRGSDEALDLASAPVGAVADPSAAAPAAGSADPATARAGSAAPVPAAAAAAPNAPAPAGAPADTAAPAQVTADSSTSASKAQSNALNALSQMEACFTDTQDYSRCTTPQQLGNTGLALVSGGSPAPGEVSLLGFPGSFMIRAADAEGQLWQIGKGTANSTKLDRVCMLRDESNFCPTASW